MSETKQITFEGRQYTVPVWVEWVARDDDYQIYGYDLEPHKNDCCFSCDQHGRWVLIRDTYDWRDSLTKV